MRLAILFLVACILATACDTSLHPMLGGFPQDTCASQSIVVTPSSDSLHVGQSLQAVAQVQSCTATSQSVLWSSSNSAVASVDQNTGLIQARGVGHASIVATSVADPSIRGAMVLTVVP